MDSEVELPALIEERLAEAQRSLCQAAVKLQTEAASLREENKALRTRAVEFGNKQAATPREQRPVLRFGERDDPSNENEYRIDDEIVSPKPITAWDPLTAPVTLHVPEEELDDRLAAKVTIGPRDELRVSAISANSRRYPSTLVVDPETEDDTHVGSMQQRHRHARKSKKDGVVAEVARMSYSPGDVKAKDAIQHAVFADAEDMKRQVRQALAVGQYDVKDYYKHSGWSQWITRSNAFEVTTLAVIAANAVWIAIDVDVNNAATLISSDAIFQVVENAFCLFFTLEWLIRLDSFRDKRDGLRDYWFIFDFALVALMIFDTWVMSIVFGVSGKAADNLKGSSALKLLRLCRLTRMARMAKLMRAVPELVVLVKGIYVASRSVMFTLVLLVCIIYLFAIVLRQLTDDTDIGAQYYPTVPGAMVSLLLRFVLADQAKPILDHGNYNLGLGVLTLFYYLLAGLTIMNMLVGVLVEVVSVVSCVEKEQLTVTYVKARLDQIFQSGKEDGIDEDGNRSISKAEFQKLLVKPEAAKIIQEIGVDVFALVDISDFIFQDDQELDFPAFMELVLQLRGSNVATVKDIVDLRKFLSTELLFMEERFMEHLLHEEQQLDELAKIASKKHTVMGRQQTHVLSLAGLSV